MSDVPFEPQDIIQVMPEPLANKIAAGEVVQRPASAAKELLENAVDAGADRITLVVKSAGSELIQVIDNGCGMSPNDAVRSFQRHATSKLKAVEDLEKIYTLGFRGEALASIGSVAQVELRTRRVGDASGTCVRVDGGAIVGKEPCAAPTGTSIAIRNLFYNVPARRNFLKSAATEFKHVIDTFQFIALSHPEIGFTLIHDDNEIYRLEPAAEAGFPARLRHRIWELWGKSLADNLVEAEEITTYVSARGLISKPTFHRKSRGEQFIFINGRYVHSRYLDHAVVSGYEPTLPDDTFPFFVLFLEVDPRHVDVNVHPTKAEVKFDDERGVYGFLRAVVKKALGSADLSPRHTAPTMTEHEGAPSSPHPAAFAPAPRSFQASGWKTAGQYPARPSGGASERTPFRHSHAARPLDIFGDRSPGELSDILYAGQTATPALRSIPSGVNPQEHQTEELSDESDRIWQLHDRYVLTQIRSGLMVLDQSAAHQRILYEKALLAMQDGLGLSQQLLFPQTVEVGPADLELLKELSPDLRALGFDVEFFSGRSVVVRGVPADIRAGNERTILEEILEQFKTNRDTLQIPARDNLARSLARRSAIPPGTRLKTPEMRGLIDQLFLCEMPYADPAGHPTMVKLSLDELAKRFGG
ncbi:MAG TPA: DNA mismatch repair endonuclease MutL [Rhodothermales bacterium]|nr:DNA mismatch repair endonuclease MutL [Rhodothermales bacterium]